MSNNVHALPTHKARGRRLVRALPDVPQADVLTFERRPETPTLTSEQRITELEEVIDEVCRGLLMATRAISAHHKKYCKG